MAGVPMSPRVPELAMKSAGELLADNVKSGSKTPVESVIVTDDSGRELMSIPAILPESMQK